MIFWAIASRARENDGSNYTVLIDNVERCTVTGNLILNESAEEEKQSLVIPFDEEIRAITAIAITGNVFQGEPSLPDSFSINTASPTVTPTTG